MYLVLMAMLALNVSNEVLNAFDVLDDGLKMTMVTLEQTNAKVYGDLEAQNAQNPEKVGRWLEIAEKVRKDADELVEFIQDRKIEMLTYGKEFDAFDPETKEINTAAIGSKDNTEVPAHIMIGDNDDKAGKQVKEMIEEYRHFLIDEVVTGPTGEEIRVSIGAGLNTEPAKADEHGKGHADPSMHSWTREHFEHLPLSGVLTIMTGLQINIRNAQSEALKYLYNQIGATDVKFNRIEATVIPNSNYIIKGNEYEAEIFMAASDTTAAPTIWVTENRHAYDSVEVAPSVYEYMKREDLEYKQIIAEGSGKAVYTAPGGSLGQKYIGGIIELDGPSGKIQKPFRTSYLVAEGSVTVAPTKMNVFYLGVDNPVDVSVAGVQPDKVSISVTNARHEKNRDSYIIKPIRPGNAYVVVYATIDGNRREMGRKEFRVKTVPNPVAMVNGQKGGRISQSVLLASIGVVAEMENFDFDLKFTVTEFTVSAVQQGFVREFTSRSNRFTAEQKDLIRNLNRGQNVYIQDIKAVGPDGSTRNLSTINFKLN